MGSVTAQIGPTRRWVAALVAVAVPLLWGLAAGWWTPRGPLGTADALWSIVISVLVGAASGFVLRSRWAMVVAPLVFVVAVELARSSIGGPTTDMPAFTTYGLLALAVGRGFHALVSWLPMLLGAAIGAGVGRHMDSAPSDSSEPTGRPWAQRTRQVIATLAALGLVAFSLALARPGRTDVIVDARGQRVEGSVAELVRVEVDGHELAMMIRGRSTDNPVLLFLAGGPGGSEMGAMRKHLQGLERYFTVATFDQRGTGKSYGELDPVDDYTLESAVDDTLAVTDYLRRRFGQERLILVGQSWGSILGILAVDRSPESYRAFVGVGQMVSPLATDRVFYDDTLRWARSRGEDALVDRLVGIGPPPYDRMLDYETALSYEHEVYPYDHSANSEGEGGFSENLLVEEYTLTEQVHLLAAFVDTFSVLYPQLQEVDFRKQVASVEVPVFFVQGAHEAPGRAGPFEEWYEMLSAPRKEVVVFDTSGHRPMFEQPEEFVDYMVETVLSASVATAADHTTEDQ